MSEHARHRGKVLRIVGFNGVRELNAYVDSQGPRWKALCDITFSHRISCPTLGGDSTRSRKDAPPDCRCGPKATLTVWSVGEGEEGAR